MLLRTFAMSFAIGCHVGPYLGSAATAFEITSSCCSCNRTPEPKRPCQYIRPLTAHVQRHIPWSHAAAQISATTPRCRPKCRLAARSQRQRARTSPAPSQSCAPSRTAAQRCTKPTGRFRPSEARLRTVLYGSVAAPTRSPTNTEDPRLGILANLSRVTTAIGRSLVSTVRGMRLKDVD